MVRPIDVTGYEGKGYGKHGLEEKGRRFMVLSYVLRGGAVIIPSQIIANSLPSWRTFAPASKHESQRDLPLNKNQSHVLELSTNTQHQVVPTYHMSS